jgi:broad specificity phosphatase PhoE
MSSSMRQLSRVRAFPISELVTLQEKYEHVKLIHVLRHAEGYHNVNREYHDIKHLDACLTPKGREQCQMLGLNSQDKLTPTDSVDLMVTSTLTRCIQTALLCFPTVSHVVAQDCIRETVNYFCDSRRPTSILQQEFPAIDFSEVLDEADVIWNTYEQRLGSHWKSHRESGELYRVAERGRFFLFWLSQRLEKNVIICSHSAFLRCFFNWGQIGGVPMKKAQFLDDRDESLRETEFPLFTYCADKEFEKYMRSDYKNCELRSFVLVFDFYQGNHG